MELIGFHYNLGDIIGYEVEIKLDVKCHEWFPQRMRHDLMFLHVFQKVVSESWLLYLKGRD